MRRFKVRKWLKRLMAGKGRIEARSGSFHALVEPGARIERVASGFIFTEGPVFRADESRLYFSDIPGDCIYALDQSGKVAPWRKPSNQANGLTLDRAGNLIACEHGARRVTRTGPDGSVKVLVDRFDGKKLNSPNDVVVRSDGTIYFTDPPYGIRPDEQEQEVQGVYRIPPGGGAPVLVADDFERPNGLAFSPDESHLYVDDSAPEKKLVRVFRVGREGGLEDGRIFADLNTGAQGTTDGMKVDRQGNLFCTGPGGVWILDPAGNHLGTIVLPEQPSNCAWGDDDFRSLYVTAESSVYRIRTLVGGSPPGGGAGDRS